MRAALKKISKPFQYLQVMHDEKRWFDWYFPFAVSACIFFAFFFFPSKVPVFGGNGLISQINGLLQLMVGFYIASLAAVATFNKPGMDELMEGTPLTLRHYHRIEELTRRKFICLLFGYLSATSILLYLSGVGANLFADNLKTLIHGAAGSIVRWGGLFVYLFLLSQIVVITFLSLYFMTDRIHRPSAMPEK